MTGSPKAERGPTVPRIPPTPVSISLPVLLIVGLSLVASAVAMYAVDSSANDGLGPLTAGFGSPMVASAVIIEIAMLHLAAHRRPQPVFLWWWLLLMPVGTVLLSIGAFVQDPEYFESGTAGGLAAVTGMQLVLVVLGIGFGALLWFFVVFPLVRLVQAIAEIARGTAHAAVGLVMPLVLLALGAFILIGAGALGDLRPGRFAGGQIIAALLGVPGSYRVESEPLLWAARILVVGIIAAFAVPALVRRARREA